MMQTMDVMRGSLATLIVLAMAQAPAAPVLESATVALRAFPRVQHYDAVIEAVRSATVAAQTTGRVVEILYDVHDEVPAGSVILRLDDSEQRARLDAAQAGVREAESYRVKADQELRRLSTLVARNLASAQDVDAARAALGAAGARLDAARAAAVNARQQLDYTVVRAPYGGVVMKRYIEIGETAQPGQPLMSGYALDQLRAVAQVPQRLVPALRATTASATVEVPGSDEPLTVSRMLFLPVADPVAHTVPVRLDLGAVAAQLLPGMLVKAVFTTGEEQRLVVPSAAVVQRGELTAVYVIDAAGAPHLRQIRAGRDDNGWVEVLSGLIAGERVATDTAAVLSGLDSRQKS